METSAAKNSYWQPIVINSIISLLVILALFGGSDDSSGNLKALLVLMGATLLFPVVNFGFFVLAVAFRRKHLIPVYGVLSVVSLALVWTFISYAARAFHKIGG